MSSYIDITDVTAGAFNISTASGSDMQEVRVYARKRVARGVEVRSGGAVITDATDLPGKWIQFSTSLQVGPGTGTAFDLGKVFYARNVSGGEAIVSAGAGVVLNGKLRMLNNETLSFVCTGADTFDVTGGYN